ncbi:hypothetical protein ACWGQ4_00730 [Streptomyces sp. NPDC055721]|uniref:hypothetical protein n=1 Tax=Streptomyces sp. NPDC127132 TaxID=3345374 RepID=UPI00362E8771
MTGHATTPLAEELSSDPLRRVTRYQTAAVSTRLRLFALLEAQGVSAEEADDLVAALEAGAVTGAQCEVVEFDGLAPGERGTEFEDGWDEGVKAVGDALVRIADRGWERRAGGLASAGELTVHLAYIRQCERADPERLQSFVRESLLPATSPHTMSWRWVLNALGEAGGLCTARTLNASGDYIVCTLDAGHYDPDDKLPFKDGKPGGWHKADASIWNDLGAACIPHAAL